MKLVNKGKKDVCLKWGEFSLCIKPDEVKEFGIGNAKALMTRFSEVVEFVEEKEVKEKEIKIKRKTVVKKKEIIEEEK